MKGIQLKLKGEWVSLPEDFSLKLEQTNPLFNEQGTFSFPFEVPLEPNRSLFKNIADPFGYIRLKDIDGMEAELWFNGVMLYKGLVETDEEVEFEDSIPMTFLSGNSDFIKRIEGLNAQDVPLDREIKLGYVVTHAESNLLPSDIGNRISLPSYMMMNYTESNISNPYPIYPFCNVRVCTSDENGKYKILEARRPYSGVCFYVMYFLDCLLSYLNLTSEKKQLNNIEDINRLAFFTTKCENIMSEKESTVPLSEIRSQSFCTPWFDLYFKRVFNPLFAFNTNNVIIKAEDFLYIKKEVYATNKNFPNVSVEDIINDLWAAFGIKIISSEQKKEIKFVLIKDLLSSDETVDLNLKVSSIKLTKKKPLGVVLTYGISDNTAFNYNDYSNVAQHKGYEDIIKERINRYNNKCFIDNLTGNAYRIKVNKDTGGDPSLFEVGAFSDYVIGEQSEDSEQIKIGFSPVIVNDVSSARRRPSTQQEFAIFAEVELLSSFLYENYLYKEEDKRYLVSESKMSCYAPELYDDTSSEEPPLRNFDSGYTLGVMRGPGSISAIEYVDDYDGEGNASWVQTVANYAFTSDSCDNYGRFFDYNGTEAGGADQTDRFSLKLVARKNGFPIGSEYANRGLVSKFLSEYLYFLENRKTVILEVDMSITQLINIDFLKRYKIGDFVGFINKISYNMTVNGMEDVVIEMYTL